ncbi:hypothetical protein RUND412_008868 [Rhizina undulata]
MKFLALTFVPFLASTVSAIAASIAYDTTYDSSSQSTLTIACSDGVNGLYTKGYSTLGVLPTFPRIGAAETIAGWNSANCGKCYQITYGSNSIYAIAVDHAASGWVLSEAAMNTLTGGLAVELGRVTGDYTEVASSLCGL